MDEFVRHFGIDWKVLLAQGINFFVLLWLLKRFAYGPVLNIMRKRREEIARGIRMREEAEEKLRNVEMLKDEVLKEARKEALAVVRRGEANAEEERAKILREAAERAKTIGEEARRRADEERRKMEVLVRQNAEGLVRRAIEKVLGAMPARERDDALIRDAIELADRMGTES